MHKIYSCISRETHLFFMLFILFHGVTNALYHEKSRSNGTIYDALQNNFSYSENIDKSHSIRSSELPKDMGHLVLIDKLLVDYDKMTWPTYGTDKPTLVSVNIYINSLGSISAANMDFGMDIYLRQSWVDPRLQLKKYGINETVTLNGEDVIDEIWTPDIFFRNLKSGTFHSMTVPNKLLKLFPDGRILFSMRLTLRLSCHMSFRLYPMDAQRCWVVLGSYAMTTDQVEIQWNADMPITIEKEIEVPEFQLVLQEPGSFYRDIDTGVFSFLNVSFVLLRQNGFHLLQTYLPTFLIVMMSWVAFFLPVLAAPARTILGVVTLLSLVSVAGGIRSKLPPVTYVKAIDIWIGGCSVMVFCAFLQFALSTYLTRMKVRHGVPRINWLRFWKVERPDPQPSDKEHTPDQKIQMRRSHAADRYARMIFPCVFLVFNLVYWIYYISERAKLELMLL